MREGDSVAVRKKMVPRAVPHGWGVFPPAVVFVKRLSSGESLFSYLDVFRYPLPSLFASMPTSPYSSVFFSSSPSVLLLALVRPEG